MAGMDFWDLIIEIAIFVVIIPPFWRIFSKAGYSGAWSLLLLIPILNIGVMWYLGFAKWPIHR